MRVLIAVTHLLGGGHLMRAAMIGRALSARGHDVTLVSGGSALPLADTRGLDFVQLPPVHCRVGDFSTLLREDGMPAGPDLLEDRRRRLVGTFTRLRPDVVVTEHFPFGRRSLAGEFQALLDAIETARPAPILLGSVRDILVAPTKPSKIERTHALVARRYRAVLVHGDADTLPLDRSWPVDDALGSKLLYTGYVGADEPTGPRDNEDRDGTVLVSGGSGPASLPLYRAALAAARADAGLRWHLLIGQAVPEQDFQDLAAEAPASAKVERARPDFRALLRRTAVFVGQAGYNTIMDIIATRARAVLVPFEQGHETEQRLRAEGLSRAGLAELLTEEQLSPSRLLAAVAKAGSMERPSFQTPLDGARRGAIIIENLAAERTSFRIGEAAQ